MSMKCCIVVMKIDVEIDKIYEVLKIEKLFWVEGIWSKYLKIFIFVGVVVVVVVVVIFLVVVVLVYRVRR